jgi:dihydroorotate dehydrogenase (fumarate)
VVLPSLFEEDLADETRQVDALLATGATGAEARAGLPDQAGYGAGPAAYLDLVERAKAELSIPVIASLNGVSRGGWAGYAARLEEAGADALELNVYETLDQLRGRASQRSIPDPAAFARANYLRTLASHPVPSR